MTITFFTISDFLDALNELLVSVQNSECDELIFACFTRVYKLFSSLLLSFCLRPNATASVMRQFPAESLLSFGVNKLDENQLKSPVHEEDSNSL
jgi:hypothetical protein